MARRFAVKESRGGAWGCFSMLASLAVVGVAAAAIAAFAFYTEASRAGPKGEVATFTVARGSSAAAIGAQLQREGLIRNAMMFRLGTRVFAPGETLQAGEYEIPANASVRDIVRLMAEGDALQHAITFPEGITVSAAMKLIEQSEYLTGDMPAAPPEGSIMPETYHVERGMTRAALLQQMRDARDRALAEIWEGRQPGLPVSTPEQLVTLASIVERETGVASERPLVAAVMVNRLRRPMRLEMDSTIIYGVCHQLPDHCVDGRLVNRQGQRRPLLASELALRTGYNTYRIDGLPPTPISNPGRAALEATAHPAQSNALYFVADGSGGHVFAATLAEHEANVARWRETERSLLAQERATTTTTTP